MNLQIHCVHFDADKKLLEYVTEKSEKLIHFYEHLVDTEIYLKLEKSENHENKVVEIKAHVPGKKLFCSERSKTFESAFDLALDTIKTQIKKEKEKARGL